MNKKVWKDKENFVYIHNLKYDLEFFKYSLYKIKNMEDCSLECIFVNRQPVEVRLSVNGTVFRFRDSFKKIQGSLKNMGDIVGLKKLENNSEFHTGWSKTFDFNDFRNWDYVKRDAEIVQMAMKQMHDNLQYKATASSDAYYYFKNMFNQKFYQVSEQHESRFSRRFPKLSYADYEFCHGAYFGGENYSNNKGKLIKRTKNKRIFHIDIKSSYPSQLRYQYLPFGQPIFLENNEKLPKDVLYIQKFRAKIKLKKGMIPYFRFRSLKEQMEEGLSDEEAVIETEFFHEFTMCNVDIEILKKNYHIEYDKKYQKTTCIFMKQKGFFDEYIDFWIEKKRKCY